MKYSKWLGLGAGMLLILSCFLPWAYYPDLDKHFSGFFSERNMYGKPGKFLVLFSLVSMAFFLIPRVWAKRVNLLVTALLAAYAIKSFILFAACYGGICPQKETGILLMLGAPVLMVIASLFPDLEIKKRED